MKKYLYYTTSITLLFTFLLQSCNDTLVEDPFKNEDVNFENLFDQKYSDHMTELGIQVNPSDIVKENLNDYEAYFIRANITSERNAKTLNEYDEHFVISVKNKENQLYTYLLSASGETELTESSLSTYTGKVRQTLIMDENKHGEYSFELLFNQGNVIDVNYLFDENAKTAECESYRDVLSCTGRKFEDNCCGFEEILGCYAGFMFCYAYRQADCYFFEDCN